LNGVAAFAVRLCVNASHYSIYLPLVRVVILLCHADNDDTLLHFIHFKHFERQSE
jgi:hypothetical protein